MQLWPRPRTCTICALSLLSTCIGCAERPNSNGPTGNVAPGAAQVSREELLKLGEEKLDAKQYDEAIELFTKAAEKSPTATSFALIGDGYWKQRKLEDADIHYRRALEVDPKHCGANHALGRDAVLLKQYQEAIQYLDTANHVCADTVLHAQNLRFRVEALLELDRLTDAEVDLQELVAEYPDNANTYEAGLLVATKKGDESLAAEYEEKLKAKATGEVN